MESLTDTPSLNTHFPLSESDTVRADRIYETILATTDDFAYIFDPQGRFLYANARLLKVWAKTLDQIIGKTCHELGYPTWHADMHMREIDEVVRTKTSIRGEVPFTGDSGISGIYDYIFQPVLNSQGEVDVIVGTTRDVTDRKRNEEKLRSFQTELETRTLELQAALEAKSESEQRYRFLADSVPQIAWTARPDGVLDYYNERWFEYAGTTMEEMAEVGWTSFVHPDDLPHAKKVWQQSIDTGCDYEVEFRIKRASDQSYRWHLVRALPMRNIEGEILQWFGTCTDIHDTRMLQERADFLARLTQKLSTVSDTSEINRIATEDIGRFLGADRCYCFEVMADPDWVRVLPDWHREDIPSLAGDYSLLSFGTPEFARAFAEGLFIVEDVRTHPWTRDYAANFEPLKLTAFAFAPFVRDKLWVASIGVGSVAPRSWTDYEISFLENATARIWPLIERANLEGTLRLGEEAQSRIAAIVESSNDAIVSKTLSGFITSWNQGAERIFGYAPQEAIGRHIFLIIPPELQKEEPEIISRLKSGQRVEHFETVRVRKDGRRIDVSLSISPIKDRTGKIIGASKIARDITEEKKSATERRKELERLVDERTVSLREAVTQMEEFSYSVSHDLRAPLRAMQGYATALLEDYRGKPIDAEAEDYLQRIVAASSRMDRLTRDVLVYSKIPRKEMKLHEIALGDLISGIVEQYRQSHSDAADIVVDSPLLPVLGNESFLAQAISNLVDNAVKFASKDRRLLVRLHTEKRGDEVRLWVEDNGIGIRPEHQSRIWGMFERVHPQHMYEGTGIGLAIVRKTIERMNGTMGVESEGAEGSRFWIQLPGPY